MVIKLKSLLDNARTILEARHIENAASEAYYLLNNRIPVTRGELLLNVSRDVAEEDIDNVMRDVSRRVDGMPLQYILGKWEFYGYEFLTLPGVLIPRSETEMLVDYILSVTEKEQEFSLLDLCSGSGCIGLAVAKERPNCSLTLFDISAAAIDAEKRNAKLLEIEDRVQIVQGDLLHGPTLYFPSRAFDIISANPPYIKSEDMVKLQKEVQMEPKEALDGGVDGLTFYRCIDEEWKKKLNENGHLVLEAGYDTAAAVASLLSPNWKETTLHKDLAGQDRMITARG